jgi:hypothetical protein
MTMATTATTMATTIAVLITGLMFGEYQRWALGCQAGIGGKFQ